MGRYECVCVCACMYTYSHLLKVNKFGHLYTELLCPSLEGEEGERWSEKMSIFFFNILQDILKSFKVAYVHYVIFKKERKT